MKRASILLAVVTFAPIALAQDEPPEPAPTTTPSAPASAQAAEGEGEEPEHPPPPPPPKPAVVLPPPVAMKDGMLRIPGGRFVVGSNERTAPAYERPARTVSTPPFWIDRTEVTVRAYRACVDRGACPPPVRSSTTCTYDAGDAELPISCVPWTSARTFCLAVGKRLPREVEWELAARGTRAARYPWGGGGTACGTAMTLASDASQKSCGHRPGRVGTHPNGASPYGVLDMSGNVEEWVADWFAEGTSDVAAGAGASHVLRGGGWLSRPSNAKATSRNWGSVREAGPNVGFRCARDD